MAALDFPFFRRSSASAGVSRYRPRLRLVLCSSFGAISRIVASPGSPTISTTASRTSVLMAKPKRSICTIGITRTISIVLGSLNICRNSLWMNDNIDFIIYSLSARPARSVNTPSISLAPYFFFNATGLSRSSIRPSTIMETLSQYSASSM